MTDRETFKQILTDHHFSVTKTRLQIFELIKNSDHPLTLPEMAKRLPKINKSSVYRNLEVFKQAEIVKEIWQSWKPKYELAEPFVEHHHHLFCKKCHKAIVIDHQKIEEIFENLTKEHHFKISSHIVEGEGLCQDCQRNS